MTKPFNLNTVVQNLPDTLKQEVNTENGSLYVNSKYIFEICRELKNNNKFQFNYLKSDRPYTFKFYDFLPMVSIESFNYGISMREVAQNEYKKILYQAC